jgi:hypothetical protein
VTLDKQQRAIQAWCRWYSQRLEHSPDHTGFEQDLFEAFGCSSEPFQEGTPSLRAAAARALTVLSDANVSDDTLDQARDQLAVALGANKP